MTATVAVAAMELLDSSCTTALPAPVPAPTVRLPGTASAPPVVLSSSVPLATLVRPVYVLLRLPVSCTVPVPTLLRPKPLPLSTIGRFSVSVVLPSAPTEALPARVIRPCQVLLLLAPVGTTFSNEPAPLMPVPNSVSGSDDTVMPLCKASVAPGMATTMPGALAVSGVVTNDSARLPPKVTVKSVSVGSALTVTLPGLVRPPIDDRPLRAAARAAASVLPLPVSVSVPVVAPLKVRVNGAVPVGMVSAAPPSS